MPGNRRRAACSLVPSPPTSPRVPELKPAQKPAPARVLEQQALKGEVQEFVPPDHRWGESFPGRQAPTTQLSLFDAGVFVKITCCENRMG